MFVGRKEELKLLENCYRDSNSKLIVVYGRRRIGKSSLVQEFLKGKKNIYTAEGIEGGSQKTQIKEFVRSMSSQVKDPFFGKINFSDWSDLFTYLANNIFSRQKGKKIIFLDELQWLASGRGKLASLLKFYWDNHWKKQGLMLILCGSVASFMIKKVINSSALYGRIDHEILLGSLKPSEAIEIFRGKRNKHEVLKYLLLFGGVPKYLEEIRLNESFKSNIVSMCFEPSGFMVNEVDKIFYNQFRETKTYLNIAQAVIDKALSFDEISKKLKISSGGSLKLYLDNLEKAEIIKAYTPYCRGLNTKFKKYRLSDEFLIFYYKYIKPNHHIIKEHKAKNLFESKVQPKWQPWLGLSFERFCVKHAMYLAENMGFADEVINLGPYFSREDNQFQIDLVYVRTDKVISICEIKYYDKSVTTKIIPEVERKINLLPIPKDHTVEKVIISPYGIDQALKDSAFFDHVVDINLIFNKT